MQKYTKIQASVQHGLYLFTCEIHSFNSRPAATILQVQFHFFDFCLVLLRQNIRPKYAPPRRTNYTLKWRGGEAAPPIYFMFTPSRRGIFWWNILL